MPKRPFTIVAFGDSITAAGESPEPDRWTSVLQTMLTERFGPTAVTVINAGVGGNTSREGLARMSHDVPAHDPDLALIQFGGNDSTFEPDRHVLAPEFLGNLSTIKAHLDALGHTDSILLNHPPVVDHKHQFFNHPAVKARGLGLDEGVEYYRRLVRDFAQTHRLPLGDLGKALRDDLEGNILDDGTHLTAKGNAVVARTVFPLVVACIEARGR